jgi:hypothetical protein
VDHPVGFVAVICAFCTALGGLFLLRRCECRGIINRPVLVLGSIASVLWTVQTAGLIRLSTGQRPTNLPILLFIDRKNSPTRSVSSAGADEARDNCARNGSRPDHPLHSAYVAKTEAAAAWIAEKRNASPAAA